ncbi:hypothetical protein MHU86_19823 [Fragilaria crotonensis]|nr:hypothetical protein MHU86_19823 [Fragilaria crotonensis]
MGFLGSRDLNTQPLFEELTSKHGMHVSIIHLEKGFITPYQIIVALDKGKFSTCIILGWGCGGGNLDVELDEDPGFGEGLVDWVESGGCLIVQGENISDGAGGWPQWFGFDWESCYYRRTWHALNSSHWFATEKNLSLDIEMSVKACMVTNVEPEERLYGAIEDESRGISEDLVAVTLARYGAGAVSFYGDVNIEEPTIRTVGMIARYAVSASHCALGSGQQEES